MANNSNRTTPTLMQRLMGRRADKLKQMDERRAETTTVVMPVQAEPESPEDPEKKDGEMDPEMGRRCEDDPEACPQCGKTGDECTCGDVGGGARSEQNQDQQPDDDESGSSPGMNMDRSGDSLMNGTNDKSASQNRGATLDQLRAASFGKDAEFVLECMEQKRSLPEAHEAWGVKLAAKLDAANQQIAGLGRLGGEGLGGTTAVGVGAPPNAAAGSKGRGKPQFASFDDAVDHFMSDRGGKLSKWNATKKAANEYPELHQAMLAEAQQRYAAFNSRKAFA